MEFKEGLCPKCGKKSTLMFNNNPVIGAPICFNCIKNNLNYLNLDHADFFCRSYNLPFDPKLWIELSQDYKDNVFQMYTEIVLDDNENKPNLYYESTTKDLWSRVNKDWEKNRSYLEIMTKIAPIEESYTARSRFKWGSQYIFSELLKLDSLYTRTLRANNITDPMQKEAVKTLCKLQVEIDKAIAEGNTKSLKDLSSTYATYAKQANLDNMIAESKTDDITTVAELYDYMEKSGWKFKYFDGVDKDEVDRAIKDIQQTNRTLILESSGVGSLVEEMAKNKMRTDEQTLTDDVTNGSVTIDDLVDNSGEIIELEPDNTVLDMDFSNDEKKPFYINRTGDKVC